MPFSDKPWSQFSDSDYADADALCTASLIDLNKPGEAKVKSLCKLRVKEPGGTLNRNGIHAAVVALVGGRGGVNAPPEEKRKAAKRLMGLYREMQEEPPESLKRMASG